MRAVEVNEVSYNIGSFYMRTNIKATVFPLNTFRNNLSKILNII